MSLWAAEGVAAIDYPHSFHPELTPSHLCYALALAGIRPPVEAGEPFTYAELGCGQGLTSNLLAAIHPEGCFEAIDVLPSHIANARRLAEASGLDNVHFAAETFADFATRPKEFDFIVLHGVWSWVGADNRAILADIAKRCLKPGGALYVSYNCLPGWAADMPVRQLLLEAVAEARGPLPDRIAAALADIERLAEAGGYFDRIPSAARHLRSLLDKGDGYLAHEYLNRHWSPFYHSDVAAALAPLTFAASATLLDHLPLPTQALIESASPARCQTIRDTLNYTRFRRDIFVRAPTRLSSEARRQTLAAMRFGLVVPHAELPDSAATPLGDIRVPTILAETLVDARKVETAELDDLVTLTALALAAPLPVAHPDRPTRCARFNAAVIEENRTDPAIRQLASATLGTALVVDLLDRLFLLAEQDAQDPPTFAWEILASRGKRLRREGVWLEDAAENLAELRRMHTDFCRHRRDRLRPFAR